MSASRRDDAETLILSEDSAGVRTLTLNQAQRFNPLSEAMLSALEQELARARKDDNVRMLVLAARGRAFCAGHDLREMRAYPSRDYYRRLFRRCSRLMLRIVDFPRPVVARVQGLATAAGCQLVATCDLAVAGHGARFAVSGITLGLFCATPGVALSRNVPRKQAFEMLMTGGFIDAQQAASLGLVNHAVPDEQLDERLDDLCAAILRHPDHAITAGKRLFYRQLDVDLPGAYEQAAEVMACNMMEQDTLAGVQAFLDKRPMPWAAD
jgi:enoyl-CoA hydratase/carnithine racemase